MKTKSKLPIWTCALFFTSLLVSCEDIIEEDITDDYVQVSYPQNGQTISSNVVNFQWQELDGADDYRVQIFESGMGMTLDSLVSGSNFTYPMNPGSYQWRIRGENSAYVSQYTFNFSFSVILTSDLTNQQVILSSPSENLYTNNPSVILNWSSLAAAETYDFELVNVGNGSVVNQQNGLTSTSLTLNSTILVSDAQYRWKVRAKNSTTQTQYSSRVFYLDRSNPNTATLLTPADQATYSSGQQANFTWSMPSDVGMVQSAISYVIEFSQSANFDTIMQTSELTTLSFQQVFPTTGDYYWRVRAKDVAGNIGLNSPIYKFTVN